MGDTLTPREVDILSLVAEGKKNHEIATILVLSPKTVENRISGILSKLGVQNRTQAAAWYIKHHDSPRHMSGKQEKGRQILSANPDENDHYINSVKDAQPFSGTAMPNSAEGGITLIGVCDDIRRHRIAEEATSRFQDVEKVYLNQDARAGLHAVQMLLNLGDYDKAGEDLTRIHRIYGPVLDDPTNAEVNRLAGWLDYCEGNFAAARHYFEQCRSIARQTGIELLGEGGEHFLGRIYFDLGTKYPQRREATAFLLHRAEEHLTRAYQIHRQWCAEALQAFSVFRIAQVWHAGGHWQQAGELRHQARQQLGKDPKTWHIDLEEARLAFQDGEWQRAGQKAQEALEGWACFLYPKGMTDALNVLGDIERRRGKVQEAGDLYVAALCIHPFDKHPDISPLWAKIGTIYADIDVQRVQTSIEERRGSFSYLNHVAADRSMAIASILAKLRRGSVSFTVQPAVEKSA